MYAVDVSVDTMHPGQRTVQNKETKLYYDQDVFDVDLSLTVKHLQTGRIVGTTGERYEHWFIKDSDDKRLVEKRAAIFKAADNLAERFVGEWAAGKYGEDLPRSMVQSDLDKLIDQATLATGLSLPALAFQSVVCIVLLIVIVVLLRAIARGFSLSRQTLQQDLDHALTLAVKTDNFSESFCRAAAAAKRPEILAVHSQTEKREVERLHHASYFEGYYRRVARYAASRTGIEKARIVEMMRQAHVWEYRVLQEAKRLAVEVPK